MFWKYIDPLFITGSTHQGELLAIGVAVAVTVVIFYWGYLIITALHTLFPNNSPKE